MSESLILSLMFGGIIVLIGFIGASFGIARGFLGTASILLGAELSLWWGDNLGGRLSDAVDISTETSRFLCGVLLLLLAVTLLGLAGSIVLAWGAPTRWGATLGALLGAANGALLIAIALRLYYLAYAGTLTSVPLDDSIVTRLLWRNFDWFVLGFVAVASALLLYTRFARLPTTVPDPAARAALSRPIPPPVPRVDARAMPEPVGPEPNPNGLSSNGSRSASIRDKVDDTIYAPSREGVPGSQSIVEKRTVVEVEATRTELPSARNAVRFCPNCGMTLDASDRFCPDCGYTL